MKSCLFFLRQISSITYKTKDYRCLDKMTCAVLVLFQAVIRSVETFGLRFKKDDSKVQNVLVDRDSMDSDSEKEEEEDEEEEMEEEEEKEEEEDSMQVDQDGELQDDEQKNNKEAPKSGITFCL